MAILPPATLIPPLWPWRLEEPVAACMDARELARWEAANDRCPWPLHAASPCRDCTADYAAEMLAEGRCHGRPGSDVFPAELLALVDAALCRRPALTSISPARGPR